MGFGIGKAIGAGLSLAGGFTSASGVKKTGKAAREAGKEQQRYNLIAAGQAVAGGQRQAFEETRQAELVASRAVAVAAAGGYSADITNLLADIEGEGAYRANIAMFEAETEAERLRFAGDQAAKYGADQYDAAKKQAQGIKLQSIGSLFSVM